MNSENSKTSPPHRLLHNLTNKTDLWRCEKSVASSDLSIYYIWKYIKSSYKKNKFKISASIWNGNLELPDRLYSRLDIQDYS